MSGHDGAFWAEVGRLAPHGVIVLDEDDRVVGANRAALSMFGVDEAAILGHRATDLLPTLNEAIGATAPLEPVAVSGSRDDGRSFPAELHWTSWRDPSRRVLYLRDLSGGDGAARSLSEEVSEATSRAADADTALRRFRAVIDASIANRSFDTLLPEVLDRIADLLHADSAAVLELDPDRQILSTIASSGPDREVAEHVEVPMGRGLAGRAAATRRPLFVNDTALTEVVSPALSQRIRSAAAVPIEVEDRIIGALRVGARRLGAFQAGDLPLLQLAADRLGVSMENARLHRSESGARELAELEVRRLERLYAVAEALVSGMEPDDAWQTAMDLALEASEAFRGAVLRYVPSGDLLEVVAQQGYDDVIDRWSSIPMSMPTPATDAVRDVAPVFLRGPDDFDARYPEVSRATDPPTAAWAGIPLVAQGERVGALALAFATQRGFDPGEQRFLRSLGHLCAEAIERAALIEREREGERVARRLIESNVVGAVVGDDRTIHEANDAFLELVGRTREELRRGEIDWRAITPAEQLARDFEAVERIREEGACLPYEKEYLRPDATRVPVQVAFALLDADPFRAIGYVLDLSERRAVEQERQRLLEQERRARSEAEQSLDRLAFLADASEVLAASLDVEEIFEQLAELAVPRLADWCVVDVLRDDGAIEMIAVSHVDPAKVELSRELRRRYPPDPDGTSGAPAVIRSGTAELMEEIPQALVEEATSRTPELAELLRALQLRSAMVVPLRRTGETFGAMTFVWAESGRHYTQTDLSLAEDLARRATVAIDNAHLYRAEQGARRSAEIATHRFELLAEAGDALAASLDADDVVREIAGLCSRIADLAVTYLVDPRGALRIQVADGPGVPHGSLRIAADSSAERDAVASAALEVDRARLFVGGRLREEHLAALIPEGPDADAFDRLGIGSAIVAPLRTGRSTFGALLLCRTRASGVFDGTDLELVDDLAVRAAQALENARLFEERSSVAETLQRSLLPPELPDVPGIEIGTVYRPAGDGSEIGGDFYDVFALHDGSWGAVIGDVCGKGAPAAAMMALARYAVRTAALTERRPSAILRTLNEALLRGSVDERFATACVGRLDLPAGSPARITVADGGHPIPFVVRNDGGVERIGAPGTLLGVFPDPRLEERSADLRPGDAVVLFTDGVTDERRGEEEFGEARLGRLLSRFAGYPAQDVAHAVVAAVEGFREDPPADDIAVVVIRVNGS
jgi:PAS domain S-box-containing protein